MEKLLLHGLVLSDLLTPHQIQIMSNEEWECAEEILRSWDLLCNHQDYQKPHILALRYWNDIYITARDIEQNVRSLS